MTENMRLYFTLCEKLLHCCIMKRYFNIQQSIQTIRHRGVLHSVKAESHVLVGRWMVKRGGEAAQLGLFKREMDRGSEQGTNIPLQRAHDSASICTPLSLPPIHHSLTASTSCFHLTPIPFSLTCLRQKCEWDSAVS